MTEYFISTNSFAAPFFSEEDTEFREAETPEAALEACAAGYTYWPGLYAAVAYESAAAFHKGAKPLARWLCNKAILLDGVTGTIYSPSPGVVEINGVRHEIPDPKGGRVVPLLNQEERP